MPITFSAISACVETDPRVGQNASLSSAGDCETYALLYCDDQNGLGKLLLNINQSNRIKRTLIFLLSRVFFSCWEFDTICSAVSNVSKGETM